VTSQSPPEAGESTDEYRNAWASIQHMVMVGGASWSGREKNCVFLNTGQRVFANASSVSRADYADDARAAAVVDWDDDGRLDVLVKNRTAPRLRLLRNQGAERGNFLKVDLVGTECNGDAIGAAVVVDLGDRVLRKTVFAGDGYLSQSSKRLHFGLADAERVVELTVHWPGGEPETFRDLSANTRVRIVQGSGQAEPVAARTHADFAQLEPTPETRLEGRVSRTVLIDKLPVAPVTIPSFEDPKRKVKDLRGSPALVNLWETTCAACLKEFGEFRERRADIEASGLRIVPLTLDEGPALVRAREILSRFGLDEGAGYADRNLMQTLEVYFVEVFGRSEDVSLPTSLLIDEAGQLVAIYQGAVDVDQLLADVALVKRMDPASGNTELLSGGRWFQRGMREFELLSPVFAELGRERLSQYYGELAERQ